VRVTFDLDGYVDVAEREQLLFERYPDARVQVELEEVRNGAGEIVAWKAKATIWRSHDDPLPVCDYAVEPVPGKTPFTRDSEAMNASTSAIGRAIVLAGFPSKKIASEDEVRARRGSGNGSPAKPEFSEARPDMTEEEYLALVEIAQLPDALASQQVVHFGRNKGALLGELTARQLGWYANDWELQSDPSPYDFRLKAAAQALHAGVDTPDFAIPF
jgi:hypothetical protein